jgi:FixJ family two-component response regulator
VKEERVLVVEDDRAMREALVRVLGAAGLDVLSFPSAEALLESGIAAGAACLVLDIRLPGMSGFELRRRLIQSRVSVPAIFITALDNEVNREQARQWGDAFLAKPFLGRELIEAVTQAIHPQTSNAGA